MSWSLVGDRRSFHAAVPLPRRARFGADVILSAHEEETELGRLQRGHQGRAALARRTAERERARNRHDIASQLESRAREYEEDAQPVMQLMRRGFGEASATTEKKGTKPGNVDDEN